MVDIAGAGAGSDRSIRFGCDPFTNWGAVAGFSLDARSDTREPYDLTGHVAIRFWAKVSAGLTVAFKIPTTATVPEGGVCTACNDHYAAYASLTTSWQQFVIQLADMAQQGWGDPVALDLSSALAFEWFTGTLNDPLQLWIDDIELVSAL